MFYPGQKVTCLYDTDFSHYITKGKTYTVKCVDLRFKLLQLKEAGVGLWLGTVRFHPVHEEIPPLEDML